MVACGKRTIYVNVGQAQLTNQAVNSHTTRTGGSSCSAVFVCGSASSQKEWPARGGEAAADASPDHHQSSPSAEELSPSPSAGRGDARHGPGHSTGVLPPLPPPVRSANVDSLPARNATPDPSMSASLLGVHRTWRPTCGARPRPGAGYLTTPAASGRERSGATTKLLVSKRFESSKPLQ